MFVRMTMTMVMVMRWRLLHGRLRMNLHHGVNLRMRMIVCMRMVMRVIMSMVVRMVMGNSIVMVVAAHAVFHTECTVLAPVARHERLGRAALQVVDPLFQQLKDLAFKPKVRR